MATRKLITVKEAARIKGCSRQAIHAAIKSNRLEAIPQTVTKTEWKVCPKSLAALKINPKMKRVGRPRTSREVRDGQR